MVWEMFGNGVSRLVGTAGAQPEILAYHSKELEQLFSEMVLIYIPATACIFMVVPEDGMILIICCLDTSATGRDKQPRLLLRRMNSTLSSHFGALLPPL